MPADTYWIEWIENCIKERRIKHYKYDEFTKVEEIGGELFGKVYRANWKQNENCVALKSFSTDSATVKQIVNEIKLHQEVDYNDMVMKFYGITKIDSDKEYLLVVEYAEGGTLRDYLKVKFTSLNWPDKYKLSLQLSDAIECLHENEIVHKNLHSNSILIQQDSIKLADFGLSKRISKDISQISLNSFDTIPYDDPEIFKNVNSPDINSLGEDKQVEKLKKSDVYSIGVIFWELSSGKMPFADKEYSSSLAVEITQGLREEIVEDTPERYSNLYAMCWNGNSDKRPTIQEVVIALTSMMSQEVIQRFKLNHGLFLDGNSIEPSKRAVFLEDGVLNTSLYKGQPLVYTFTNDRSSHTNLLSFDSDSNNINFIEFKALQQSDICINFPVAEITYDADLSESFSNFADDDKALYRTYGHLFAKKIFLGGKLFIDDFKSVISSQIDTFKSLLAWTYDSAKYNKENPFNNLSTLNFFPKIRSDNGEELDTPKKLTDWMNMLYQKDIVDIISYNNLIPISELRFNASPLVDTFHDTLQPGIINFKEALSLEEWVKDSIYFNLKGWIKEFHLLQGLIINEYFEVRTGKKIAINFIKVPNIVPRDKFYLEIIKPKTKLEEILINNNISSANDANNIISFPFVERTIKSDDLGYEDNTHCRVKHERYKISLAVEDIRPSKNFQQDIEKAFETMKPLVYLQNVFDEYGHFYPLSITLGKSLKNNSLNFSDTSKKIDLELPTIEPLKLHLDNLNISCLLTQKGNVIDKNDLSNWFHNAINDLEVIEFDNMIPSYYILEEEQQRKIDIVLNRQDDFKIIMTGIDDLKDLDDNKTEHYKRINVNPSLEDENYEVFGSIISKNNLKIEDFFVTFGLYDFNGFSAMIKSLKNTNIENIDITECYILWMIVGNPSKLLVFSPKNRDCQVNYFNKSIILQPNQLDYYIETRFPLSQGHTVSINAQCSANYEVINIKLVRWSNDCMHFQIGELNSTNVEINVHICILSSNSKSLKIDNEEKECYLDLIGYTLSNLSVMKNLSIKGKRRQTNEEDQSKESKHSRIDDIMDIDYSNPLSHPSPSYSVTNPPVFSDSTSRYNEVPSESNKVNLDKRTDTNELVSLIYAEKHNEFKNLLDALRYSIDYNKMQSAKEFLQGVIEQSAKRSGKINRPPNSNIIYTNQLNKFGLLDIVRKFCDREKINKQSLVPISKKLSKILWKELSEKYRNFFEKLAAEVATEHKKLFPNYKYTPKRKRRAGTYKHYDPIVKTTDHDKDNVSQLEDKLTEFTDELSLSSFSSPSSSINCYETDEEENDPPPTFSEPTFSGLPLTFSELPPSSPSQVKYSDIDLSFPYN